MIESGNDGQRISRRAALAGTALALGATITATAARQAAAQQIPQELAQYEDTPKGDDYCEVCNYFQPPKACKVVQGEISPNGWCQLFSRKT